MHAPRYQRMASRAPVPELHPISTAMPPSVDLDSSCIRFVHLLPNCNLVFCDPDPAWLHRLDHHRSSLTHRPNTNTTTIINTTNTSTTTIFNAASAAPSRCSVRCC